MKGYEIELEDKGQEYGYLKYKVLAIKEINY